MRDIYRNQFVGSCSTRGVAVKRRCCTCGVSLFDYFWRPVVTCPLLAPGLCSLASGRVGIHQRFAMPARRPLAAICRRFRESMTNWHARFSSALFSLFAHRARSPALFRCSSGWRDQSRFQDGSATASLWQLSERQRSPSSALCRRHISFPRPHPFRPSPLSFPGWRCFGWRALPTSPLPHWRVSRASRRGAHWPVDVVAGQ